MIKLNKYAVISALLFYAFASFAQKAFNVTIKGKLQHNGFKNIYLDRYANTPSVVDSVAILNNSFEIKASINETGFYNLRLADDRTLLLILEPNDNIELTADVTDFQQPLSISGSRQSVLVFSLNRGLKAYERKQDSLNKVYEAHKTFPNLDSIVNTLRLAFDGFADKQNQLIIDHINKNLTSLSGILFISRLKINDNIATYSRYDSAIFKAYPNNTFVKDFHQQVFKTIRLAIGNYAPDIILKDTAGQQVALSKFKGKYVLVDFWASWCGPCRRESAHMVKLYNEFHEKGFEIFSVSLDKDRNAWLNAIRHDKLKWTHGSDLGFWNSAPAQLYNVSSIPYTVLLDRKGRIVAKGLFGAEIDDRLNMLLKDDKN